MNIPGLLLSFLIASMYGAIYHLWRGGGLKKIAFYLFLAWLGFFAGHYLALWRGWQIIPLGILNLGFATLGALFFLVAGGWLGDLDVKD